MILPPLEQKKKNNFPIPPCLFLMMTLFAFDQIPKYKPNVDSVSRKKLLTAATSRDKNSLSIQIYRFAQHSFNPENLIGRRGGGKDLSDFVESLTLTFVAPEVLEFHKLFE